MGHLTVKTETNQCHNESISHSGRYVKGAFACTINSEIGAVLAVMRRNVRWGVQYVSDVDKLEHNLIHSLKDLRKKIFSWHNEWDRMNPSFYLQPFLDVIRSDETGAPITGVALSSVYKILTLDVFDIDSAHVGEAMHKIVDAVTTCRFEVTDSASEEVVLMKILQVLLACMKNNASVRLSNQHVCNMVNTCFRVVHQASSKGELLQRIARNSMHELVRCIFSRLPSFESHQTSVLYVSQINGKLEVPSENGVCPNPLNEEMSPTTSNTKNTTLENNVVGNEENTKEVRNVMLEPFGVPCMVEIFHFLCSLLNMVENFHTNNSRSNPVAYDEDVPLFALGLINSAIELGGASFSNHPDLLSLIQGELFRNMLQFGLSMSPLILSTVCSIVINLYHSLRCHLKVQLESFFSCVLLRVAQGKNNASYQQQEVAMEALVDLCRQPGFMAEMYVNFDCDTPCNNIFEEVVNLLSKCAFPVNGPLTAMHIVALDGLLSMINDIADRTENDNRSFEANSTDFDDIKDFWTMKCGNYDDPAVWVPHIRKLWHIKRRLMVGGDHFNSNPKKGLQVFQEMNLVSNHRDPNSVANLFRYTFGLDKILIGDFLGNHDELSIKVLHSFSETFDFRGVTLDTALRMFLGTFKLPGESQKIHRILEAFAERYYDQSPDTLASKDATLLLSYSIIMLNTDHHNAQVKKKMTEDDFIRNNRLINDGKDLPREYLSELYHSICENEIQMNPEQGSVSSPMTHGRWINVMHKANITAPYICCESEAILDCDILQILLGPTIAALSVVFDQTEHEEVLQSCVDGFSAIAKISAFYHYDKTLDDLVVSLCKFSSFPKGLSHDAIFEFGSDIKARMATIAAFSISNHYGDYLRSGWKNLLDCILSLHKLGLLPRICDPDGSDSVSVSESENVKPPSVPNTSKKTSGLMGRFTQLLSFESEEAITLPTEEELAAHQNAREAIKKCNISAVFQESKFLHADSLTSLVSSIIDSANRGAGGPTGVLCLELLIVVTLNNRDRIMLIWQSVYDHIAGVVQATNFPCALVEKAVFGLLKICQRLLPYKENLSDDLLKSLQLILKLDARVADAYCEPIMQEVMRLVKANASHITSHVGWRSIISLLSITARHVEASEAGFETLKFIMSDGAYLFPTNFTSCVDAATQFAESRLGDSARSLVAVDLMTGSVPSVRKWSATQETEEMWVKLVQAMKKACLDDREEVRNHAILMLQRVISGVDGVQVGDRFWSECFDSVIFPVMDRLLEVSMESSLKEFIRVEKSLVLATKLMTKAFLQLLQDLSLRSSFCKLWIGVLNRMENYMKFKHRGKRSEKIHELIPEVLKNILLVMKTTGVLVKSDDSFWHLTWMHVNNVYPSLQAEVFPQEDS